MVRPLRWVAAIFLLGTYGCGPVAQGRRALDEGAFELAARHFREAAGETPEDPDRWSELGQAEMYAERPARAREAFERVAALRPDQAGPRILIGMTWEMQRRYDEALIHYEMAREVDPADARAHRILGTRLLRWGEAAAAVAPLAEAVRLEPSNGETWNALGLARFHADDLEGAERTFRDGLRERPEHRPLYLGLAALLIGQARHAEALEVYDRVVERWERFPAAQVGRGILLHELGRYDEAEQAFVRAVSVARDARPYRRRLAEYRAHREAPGTAGEVSFGSSGVGPDSPSAEGESGEASPR